MNLTDATAVYAGTTEAQAVYYGVKKLWPFTGWRQVGSTILGSAAGDQLGYAVTINAAGDRIAASSPYNDEAGSNTGSVRVLQWNGTAWGQMGASILGNTTPVNTLGQSLSMSDDGSILAVSSLTGYVRVYEWNGTAWGQKGSDIFQTSGNPPTGDAKFGESISLSGDGTILAIGVPSGNSYTGYVRVYDWNGTSWTQRGLNITESGSRVGQSVALSEDGSKLAIGARYNGIGLSNAGTVRVLEWNGSNWLQIGSIIQGSAAGDESGFSVDINAEGTRIAIGARYHGGYAGDTRIFEYIGTTWTQLGSSILGAAGNDWSGASVSLNATGDMVAIGSERADSGGTDSGHVRVYQWSGTSWSQIGATIDGAAAGDNFFPVALNASGTRLIAGGKFNDAAGANAGHAKVFEFVV